MLAHLKIDCAKKMLLIEGLRSLQRPTYLQTPIGGHHHQLRSLDLVGQLTTPDTASHLPSDVLECLRMSGDVCWCLLVYVGNYNLS